ncbi:hypothetical protein Agub_g7287 [Astrephomene gubernaculifera]|uniref:Mitochondrial carrier protein n=1 Tax=Astrephomene gubernaculifera TaxID=47775 RepID=A0AAD3DS75_9CHLO|nr:hypothetical protein Agub_g7287 [Astrephomene gubernaculifera]
MSTGVRDQSKMATAGSSALTQGVTEHHDPVKDWLRSNVPLFGRELMAGGAAGAVAKTFVAPVERTKILLMTGKAKMSAYNTIKLLFQTEGVAGLFRGNGASCLRIVPYAALHFSSYEFYKRLLSEGVPTTLSHTSTATASSSAVAASSAMSSSSKSSSVAVVSASNGISSSADGSANTETRDEWDDDALVTAEAVALGTKPVVAVEAELQGLRRGDDAVEDADMASQQQQQLPQQQQPQVGAAGGAAKEGGRRRLGSLEELVAGSMAGATAVLATYPLDVVRTRLAWVTEAGAADLGAATSSSAATAAKSAAPKPAQVNPYHPDHGIFRTISLIARQEGMLGLYRGLAPTLYGIMPYAGLKFYVYGLLKQWYREVRPPQQQPHASHGGSGHGGAERLPVPVMLMFGGTAGLVAQTATYPLDVVRRRMQVFGLQDHAAVAAASAGTSSAEGSTAAAASTAATSSSSAAASSARGPSTWGTAVHILRSEGPRGLVRGLSLNFLKVVPSTAVGFTMYDMFKQYLDIKGTL